MAIIYWDLLAEDQETVIGQEGLSFDAVLREEVTQTATPTEFPVEKGAVVSDHVQPNQVDMALEVFVTDTPVVGSLAELPKGDNNEPATDRAPLPPGRVRGLSLPLPTRNPVVNTETGQVLIIGGLPSQRLVLAGTPFREGGRQSASLLQFDETVDRVALVFETLTELINRSTKLNVIIGLARGTETSGRTFENMFLTNFQAPRDPTSGSGLTFSLALRQLTIAETTQDTRTANPRNPSYRAKKDQGPQATKEDTGGRAGRCLELDALARGQHVIIPCQGL